MHDLLQDVLKWDRFYLSGRLQKPVRFCLLLMHLFPLPAILLIFMHYFLFMFWRDGVRVCSFMNSFIRNNVEMSLEVAMRNALS